MSCLVEDKRLLEASQQGKTDLVLQLLEDDHGHQLHSHKDEDGKTALHLAAMEGHLETVTALLLNGAEVNAQDFTGHTALQRASSEGHLEVVKYLVTRGAAIDHQDEVHGNTALHECSWKGFSQTVDLLCQNKSNYYLRNRGGFSPLHLCCQNGHNETCRILLKAGCKPNIKNNYGDTPLHTAARYGHAGVARILISAKCNPDLQNKNGDTPLHISSAMGRRKLTRIILEATPDLTMTNQQKETPIDIAVRKGHEEIKACLTNPPKIEHASTPHVGIEIADGVEVIEERQDKGHRKKKHKSPNRLSQKGINWSPYGCHKYPDPTEFPDPNPTSLPEEPLKNGEQYFLDLAGNIKKGPSMNGYTCYCAPFLHRVEKKMDRNKRELFKHLDITHGKINNRINHLEKKTKDQIYSMSNNMKETFAQERLECQDRMERRAIRDRLSFDRNQEMREILLRGDLSQWLQSRIGDLESHNVGNKDAAFMRTLLRSSKRRKKAFWSELQSGTLRRAASEDDLHIQITDVQDVQSKNNENKELLTVSDHPNFVPTGVRVRRNSAGDTNFHSGDFGDFQVRELAHDYHLYQNDPLVEVKNAIDSLSYSTNSESHSYHRGNSDRGSIVSSHNQHHFHENSHFSWNPSQPKGEHKARPMPPPKEPVIYQNFNMQAPKLRPQLIVPTPNYPSVGCPPLLPPKHHHPPPYRPAPLPSCPAPLPSCAAPGPLRPLLLDHASSASSSYLMFHSGAKTVTSSDGSHDSHNDSGYCAIRPGGTASGGPSPSLSGSQGRPDSRGPLELISSSTEQPSSLRSNHSFQPSGPSSNHSFHPSGPTSNHSLPIQQTGPTTLNAISKSNSSSLIGPRIRQLQQQLSLARLKGSEDGKAEENDIGSLV